MEQPKPLKLIQLNLWQGRLLRHLVKFIEAEDPDILCLQEVYSREQPAPDMHEFYGSYQRIRSLFPGDDDSKGHDRHGFFAPNFELKGVFKYGNAILSKIPFIEKPRSIFVNGEFISYETPADYQNVKINQRNLQIAKIDVGGQPVNILNHHGYWSSDPNGSAESLTPMEAVATEVKNLSGQTILAGDFNLVPESPALQPIHDQLEDLAQVFNVVNTLSSYGKVQNVVCDHVFVSDGVKVESLGNGNLEVPVSDHDPQIVEFRL